MIKKTKLKKTRSFGLIAGLIFFGLTFYQTLHVHTLNPWMLTAGILFIIAGLFLPSLINPVRIGLEYIGRWMGIANTYILLTLIYIVLFIPLSLIFKMTGKDDLKLKRDKLAETYWIDKQSQDESSMKNQF
jgi:hypothetical protein